jgi:hypothetical protein
MFKNVKIKILRTIVLPVLLNGCETYLVPVCEGYRIRVFENRVQCRMFVLMWGEVTGGCRKLHDEVLNLYL